MVVIFKPTLRCNIKCKHCYVGDFRSFYRDMSQEQAIELLGKIPEHSEVVFHGGEPTLMGVDYYKEIVDAYRDRFSFSIQTNLTLIDESWAEFIKDQLNSRISTSFDYLNSLRPIDVTDWIKRVNLLGRYQIFPYVVSMFWLGNENMSPAALFKFFNDLNLSFRVNCIELIGYAKDTLRHTPGRYAELIKSLFSVWFMNPHSNIIIDPCGEILSFFLLGSSVKKCPFTSKCVFHIVSVNPNGDVFPCAGFESFPGFCYGNLFQKENFSELFENPVYAEAAERLFRLPQKCKDCPYINICEGGCRLEALAYYGDIYRETSLCSEYKNIFAFIEQSLEKESEDSVLNWWFELLRKRGQNSATEF